MESFTKTAQFKFRKPTSKKQKKLDEAMQQSLTVANETSKRLPSIPHKYIRSPQAKGSPLYNIVKDLRNNGISLNANTAFEAVGKAQGSFLSQIQNKNFDSVPCFHNPFARLHNRDVSFFVKDNTFYVVLKLFPYEKIVLPFVRNCHTNFYLDKIINNNLDYGCAEIKKYDNYYSLNLTVKKQVDLKYIPETFIGVDLGLNIIAWAVAVDKNQSFLEQTHIKGGKVGWMRDRFSKKHNRLQKEGNLKMVNKVEDRENRWMQTFNHQVSRHIVDFAKQFKNPMILLEDIKGREIRKRVNNPLVHKWDFGKLREYIQYKALEEKIKTKLVNPRDTSRKCSKCGHIEKNNRHNIKFKCKECGYSNHSDFNAANNIALKGEIKEG